MNKILDRTYVDFINDLKNQIKTAQIKAHLAVNHEMISLYFSIGQSIIRKQEEHDWGSKIIDNVARDLKLEFPNMTGLSPRNVIYMRKFAKLYENIITQQAVAQLQSLPFFNIPWGHNVVIMDKDFDYDQGLWYAKETIKNGWSRNVLMHQIKSDLYKRQTTLEKTHNFDLTLPSPQSDLASELLKDEYNFEFLRGSDFKERQLEDHLVDNIVKFLLELGKGFAFIGKQYHLEVGGQDFYLDLLFYNVELSCFVIIELKTGEFKPEYAGKLGFYLSVVDEKLKKNHDQSTIGIILCTKNNKEISKHSVRYMTKPIGVSEYKIAEEITDKKIKEIVPSADEIESISID